MYKGQNVFYGFSYVYESHQGLRISFIIEVEMNPINTENNCAMNVEVSKWKHLTYIKIFAWMLCTSNEYNNKLCDIILHIFKHVVSK